MKALLLSIFAIAITTTSFSQGTILGITTDPVNPIETDTIWVYADVQFGTGDCLPDQLNSSVVGNTIFCGGHHCLGLLTVICTYTDTFMVLPQAPGTYTVDFTLTSGQGGPPCTPGIIPDDTMTFSFVVDSLPDTSGNSINELLAKRFTVFPNPSNGQFMVQTSDNDLINARYEIYGLEGSLIGRYTITELNAVHLSSGTYMIQAITQEGIRSTGKRIIVQN